MLGIADIWRFRLPWKLESGESVSTINVKISCTKYGCACVEQYAADLGMR